MDEDSVTSCLKEELNSLLAEESVPGFSRRFFETVSGDSVVASFDYSSLEKRPDLAFRLAGPQPHALRPEYSALFAECKIVGKKRHQGVPKYCTQGVARFVGGDYAWAMPSGLMVAYVRDGRSVGEHLARYLRRYRQKSPDPFATVVLPRKLHGASPAHTTTHDRPNVVYPGGKGTAGPIRLIHLWLES